MSPISVRIILPGPSLQAYSTSDALNISAHATDFDLFKGELLIIPFYKPQVAGKAGVIDTYLQKR